VQLSILRRKFAKIFFSIAFILLTGWGTYRLSTYIFTIRSIEIVGEHAQVVIDEKRISRNLLFFPSETLRQKVLSDNPWLEDVRFEKKLPGTLRIVPILRAAVAILHTTDRVVLIDAQGMVVSDGDNGAPLPVFSISTPTVRVGGKIQDQNILLALALLEHVKDIHISKIILESGSYLRAKGEGIDILVVQDKPIEETLTTLQMLLSGFRIKGTLPSVVDLRFDKPVVKF
jgi:hypothetical protein